ncbi:hypothetical protein SCHPADRAFT_935618 [Schizopora paradoxa]|uniref:Uncharacterized protein n=1 Tax=Schizopora paradoxa TaxID=27342 RepID=A0A0H2SPM8_9AGAM|nr:hypothetical protein SCHPADRAFT_935618 [Schizopora paradoxa]
MAQPEFPVDLNINNGAQVEGVNVFGMENWIFSRLNRQLGAETNAQYEASTYGILNSILNLQFPSTGTGKFMVKPQGIYRALLENPVIPIEEPELEEGEIFDPFDMSFDPDALPGPHDVQMVQQQHNPGQMHRTHRKNQTSGGVPGGEIQYVPDFIVVKATGHLGYDITICIVEVKRDDKKPLIAQDQIKKYLLRGAQEHFVVGKLRGFLILNNKLEVYEINVQQFKANPELAHVVKVTALPEIHLNVPLLQGQSFQSNNHVLAGLFHHLCRKYWGPRNQVWRQYNWHPQAQA